MAFEPERFMSSENEGREVFDIIGSSEIKMMLFGLGRRMCPGYSLTIMHLEYFVGNLCGVMSGRVLMELCRNPLSQQWRRNRNSLKLAIEKKQNSIWSNGFLII